MNHEEISEETPQKNFPRKHTISMNKTLINLLQQYTAKELGEKRKRKEDTIRYGYQRGNTSGGRAARSIVAVQQVGQIIER